ncbi:class I SAM-dependent RNA methyltransferase [Limisalsivibrio acetivorans]|uniref:class I SAM-dependent RNA methyltransferase n=1 Tax=Limisalsivibrio acetivorans TaxID=1304888 RepID=UPI0003B3FC34|nr:RsmD family RNA methyltransferase [Limisalsivibrio acetivorans]
MRFTTDIRDTAYGGYGVGELPDGRAAFIPFTVEGDRVEAEVIEEKKKMAFCRLIDVVTPSDKRVKEPHCPHVGRCGGCLFGHIDIEEQRRIKMRFIREAFERGGLEIPEIGSYTGEDLGYRCRITFKVQDGRIGFYAFRTNDFIPIDDCPVTKSDLVQKAKLFAEKNRCCGDYDLYAVENCEGETIAHMKGTCTHDIVFCAFDGIVFNEYRMGTDLLDINTPMGRQRAGFETFLQSNGILGLHLQKGGVEAAGEGERALELFCGSGFFTLGLAKNYRHVDAVEVSKEAVRLARTTGLENVEWTASDVDRFLNRYSERPDTIFVDPPRTGLSRKTLDYIKRSGANRLVYVSCNPATMARDAGRLRDLYTIESMDFYDMFPHTYHVESLAVLKKK